jgi:cytochrome c-type biogenesis protein CcmH/NrfG
MLFSMTRQSNFAVIAVSGFFCLTVLVALTCILTSAPLDKADYHYKQAQFLERGYHSLNHAEYVKTDLLRLQQTALLQSLRLNPYNAAVWKNLSDVAQRNQKMTMANQALRFSHQFSGARTVNDLPHQMTVASNDVAARYE